VLDVSASHRQGEFACSPAKPSIWITSTQLPGGFMPPSKWADRQAATRLQAGRTFTPARFDSRADPRGSQPRTWPLVLHPDDEPITLSASVTRVQVIRMKCSAPEHSWRGVRECSEILSQPASLTPVESRRTTLPHNRLQLFTRFNVAATSDRWSPPILEHNPSDETAVMAGGATQYARRGFPHGRGFGP
jgi:hypothetical protein